MGFPVSGVTEGGRGKILLEVGVVRSRKIRGSPDELGHFVGDRVEHHVGVLAGSLGLVLENKQEQERKKKKN